MLNPDMHKEGHSGLADVESKSLINRDAVSQYNFSESLAFVKGIEEPKNLPQSLLQTIEDVVLIPELRGQFASKLGFENDAMERIQDADQEALIKRLLDQGLSSLSSVQIREFAADFYLMATIGDVVRDVRPKAWESALARVENMMFPK